MITVPKTRPITSANKLGCAACANGGLVDERGRMGEFLPPVRRACGVCVGEKRERVRACSIFLIDLDFF